MILNILDIIPKFRVHSASDASSRSSYPIFNTSLWLTIRFPLNLWPVLQRMPHPKHRALLQFPSAFFFKLMKSISLSFCYFPPPSLKAYHMFLCWFRKTCLPLWELPLFETLPTLSEVQMLGLLGCGTVWGSKPSLEAVFPVLLSLFIMRELCFGRDLPLGNC